MLKKAMPKNPPDERLVYLALKEVFQGQDAQLRKKKKVRNLIIKHQNKSSIQNLIREHNIDNVCQVTMVLLDKQVFESTLKAKIRFPEVFEVSPNQTAERAISELEAARNEDAAIQVMMDGHRDEVTTEESNVATSCTGEKHISDTVGRLLRSQQSQHITVTSTAISFYPVYLPFDIQHRLLTRVQHALEQACYVFAQQKLGDLLKSEEWDCAEAVELNRWPRVFLTHQIQFDADDLVNLGKPLPELLNSISQLRHTAVHRLRLTAKRALQFIVDAESLVKLFKDDDFVYMISTIRRQTQTTIEELERNKDLLESRLATTKREFAAKRAELDRQEQEAIALTIKEDKDYAIFAGINLEQALDAPATVIHSQTATEDSLSSDAEVDDDNINGAGPSQKYMNQTTS